MLIKRTNVEDISILDLLVSKLEECMDLKSIKFFEYSCNTVDIGDITRYDEDDRRYERCGDYESDPKENLGPRPVKRVKILFDSKAHFFDHNYMDSRELPDDGVYTSSLLNIEWDYVTSVFHILIGANTYERELNSKNQRKVYGGERTTSDIYMDFDLKYRHEIRLIKVRLGRLYSKLIRDKAAEREAVIRKKFTAAAVSAFPDLLDPLILGGSLNEERNRGRILSEGRDDQQDPSVGCAGNAAPTKSI